MREMRKNKNEFKLYGAVIAVFISASLLLTSCAGSELNRTVFVTSLGISFKDGIYSAALYGSVPSDEGIEKLSAEGSGKTPGEALANARLNCGKELFLGHCDKIAANSAALKDRAVLSKLSDNVISPACRVYFSEAPEKAAEHISDEGYSTECYTLAVSAKNGTPMVIPLAEDTERAAVITASETFLSDSTDTAALTALRGEAFPKTLTVAAGDTFETVKISPKAHREGYFKNGILIFDVKIELNAEEASSAAAKSAAALYEESCRRVFAKTVNTLAVDAVNIADVCGYTREQLKTAVLRLEIE